MSDEKKAPVRRKWSEQYGAHTGSPSEVVDLVHMAWGTSTTVCVVSEAGIGKTQTLKYAAEQYRIEHNIPEEDFGFVYCVLAHKDREHVTGLYYFSPDGETFRSMHDHELKAELEKPSGMYFIDEFNRPRDPALLNAFFALVSERGANGLYLNPDWTIVTAINPSSAEYMVAQVERDSAFRRRLCWVEMLFSPPEWFAWAKRTKKIHPEVMRYLTDDATRIHDPAMQDEGKLGPTPAAWEDVSQLIWNNEKMANPKHNKVVEIGVAGKVGIADASRLMANYTRQKPGQELPSAATIITTYASDKDLRKTVKEKLAVEAIGVASVEELEKKMEELGGADDAKGWLLHIIQSVVTSAINLPFEDILLESGLTAKDLDAMSELEIREKAVAIIAQNVAIFAGDLPPELFGTFTSLWAENARASDDQHKRALEISLLYRDYPAFKQAARNMRSAVRKSQK